MADFLKALPFVLAHEGGWSDDPADPGGATMKGITLQTARKHGITTKEELRAISDAKVKEIYRADYWRFSGVHSQEVATKLFDMAVNFGMAGAVRLVQEGLNDEGAGLLEDGVWGPKTEGVVNAIPPQEMIGLLCSVSAARYREIVSYAPQTARFLKGWIRRAHDTPSPDTEFFHV